MNRLVGRTIGIVAPCTECGTPFYRFGEEFSPLCPACNGVPVEPRVERHGVDDVRLIFEDEEARRIEFRFDEACLRELEQKIRETW